MGPSGKQERDAGGRERKRGRGGKCMMVDRRGACEQKVIDWSMEVREEMME